MTDSLLLKAAISGGRRGRQAQLYSHMTYNPEHQPGMRGFAEYAITVAYMDRQLETPGTCRKNLPWRLCEALDEDRTKRTMQCTTKHSHHLPPAVLQDDCLQMCQSNEIVVAPETVAASYSHMGVPRPHLLPFDPLPSSSLDHL